MRDGWCSHLIAVQQIPSSEQWVQSVPSGVFLHSRLLLFPSLLSFCLSSQATAQPVTIKYHVTKSFFFLFLLPFVSWYSNRKLRNSLNWKGYRIREVFRPCFCQYAAVIPSENFEVLPCEQRSETRRVIKIFSSLWNRCYCKLPTWQSGCAATITKKSISVFPISLLFLNVWIFFFMMIHKINPMDLVLFSFLGWSFFKPHYATLRQEGEIARGRGRERKGGEVWPLRPMKCCFSLYFVRFSNMQLVCYITVQNRATNMPLIFLSFLHSPLRRKKNCMTDVLTIEA